MDQLKIIKTGLAALIITALSLLADVLLTQPGNAGFYLLLLAANFLICLNLGLLAVHSRYNKLQLIALLSLVLWSVNRLNSVI